MKDQISPYSKNRDHLGSLTSGGQEATARNRALRESSGEGKISNHGKRGENEKRKGHSGRPTSATPHA